MILWKLSTLVVTACLVGVAGCAGADAPAVEDGQLSIIASFYPLEFLSSRIGGDEVTVTGLTTPGAEPHDLELSPRQIASLTKADLVVYEKGFQVAVDEAIQIAEPVQIVDVGQGIELLPAVDDGHEHSAGEAEIEREQGTLDPHIWLDPENMIAMADSVTRALIEAAPAHKQTFTANNAALQADLESLDSEFKTGLKTCERREFITTHAAFGYLAKRYDLTQIPIREMDPEAEPSPARIAEVQKIAKGRGTTTIFYETLVSPAVAKSIARDLGLKTAVLDPLEGLTKESEGRDYVEVMRSNLTALSLAGGCS